MTERVRMEPARMPRESVARSAKVAVRRWLRRRARREGGVLRGVAGVSMGGADLFVIQISDACRAARLARGSGEFIARQLKMSIAVW